MAGPSRRNEVASLLANEYRAVQPVLGVASCLQLASEFHPDADTNDRCRNRL